MSATTNCSGRSTPFGTGPEFIIRDRDAKFGADDRVAKGASMRVVKTAVRAPLMNSICERFLGSVRRECLDHVIILGEAHLCAVLGEYVEHFKALTPKAPPHERTSGGDGHVNVRSTDTEQPPAKAS